MDDFKSLSLTKCYKDDQMKVAEMNSTRIPSLLLKYACEILVGISERNVNVRNMSRITGNKHIFNE